jgi:hypothetical protein
MLVVPTAPSSILRKVHRKWPFGVILHVCLRLQTPLSSWALTADMQDWDNIANDRPPFQPRYGRSIPAPPCSLHLIDITFPVLQPRVLDKMLDLKPKTKVISSGRR